MTKIKNIIGREIIDSRGNPTIEVDLILDNNITGRASVPSGASTGTLEACELRDNDKNRYLGKGVLQAVNNINGEIADSLIGFETDKQKELDQKLIDLDGTQNKKRIGANAILGVSLAYAHACAKSQNIPLYKYLNKENANILPVPMMNIINGGAHANNPIDIQEFMIMPISAGSIKEAIQMGAEIFHNLKKLLNDNNYATSVGDEGGFAPDLSSTEEAISFIIKATENSGYEMSKDIVIALDAAASEFYQDGKYHLKGENKILSSEQLISYYQSLCEKYPIYSIEDAMAENDYEGWQKITAKLGDKIQLVGDDLFVTNSKILQKGIDSKMANAILIKVNQIGTLTETLDAINLGKKHNYNSILSHRSGETEDTTISHIAVATNCGQIKTGSLSRTDRIAKYNELIRIEELLSNEARYNKINISN